MAGGQRLISWLHPCSTSNVALNTRTCTHGPLMGHPNWARCDISFGVAPHILRRLRLILVLLLARAVINVITLTLNLMPLTLLTWKL
jgi:hypothetical protein